MRVERKEASFAIPSYDDDGKYEVIISYNNVTFQLLLFTCFNFLLLISLWNPQGVNDGLKVVRAMNHITKKFLDQTTLKIHDPNYCSQLIRCSYFC